MSPRIRDGTRADVAVVLRLWKEAGAVPSVTDDGASLRRAVDDGGLLVAVADDDQIVGSLIAVFDGWRGNMYRLAVAPDARRAGVARALVAEGERRLAERGCVRITALVEREDERAGAFWLAAGYVADHGMARFVTMAAEDGPTTHPAEPD